MLSRVPFPAVRLSEQHRALLNVMGRAGIMTRGAHRLAIKGMEELWDVAVPANGMCCFVFPARGWLLTGSSLWFRGQAQVRR